jgi:Asp-tRNA(Asn)/Glu-tRNA(Gln) amidotransferase B subunit
MTADRESPRMNEDDVRITRLHLEEDAGKNAHEGLLMSIVATRFNRAGVPLAESSLSRTFIMGPTIM